MAKQATQNKGLIFKNSNFIVSFNSNGIFNEIIKNRVLFLMLLPAFLFFLIFNYLPMPGVILAFKNYNNIGGIFGSPWVGFENFRFLYISGDLFTITRNTVLYNLLFITINTILQVLVAILLSEISGRYYKKFSQSALLLPHFISFVLLGAFVYNLFNYEYGTLNTFLKSLHLNPVNLYEKPVAWIYIITAFQVWKSIGFGSIIFLAAIISIDKDYYEAAKIDGAGIFKQIRFITLPLIRPTIIIYILLQLGSILRGQFELFYQITGGNTLVLGTTDIIDTYAFRALAVNFDIGMGAAVGLYQSLFGFLVILTVNYLVRRYEKESALF